VKIVAAIAAGAILVALAFFHPAPAPPVMVSSPGVAVNSPGVMASLKPVLSNVEGNHARAGSRAAELVVYVAGEVRNAGLYRVPPGARADDAVRKAGSFTTQADRAAVNLAEVVQDGEEIRVPKIGEKASASKKKATRNKRSRSRSSRGPHVTVDLNAAGAADLAQLPGVGETLAARIVAYRSQNGPFASLDELADVSGMTQRRVDALAQYVIVR
jgi:competence protein ComEA